MREPSADIEPFGILVEFDAAERLVEAAGRTRAEGFCSLDAYSPFPLPGLSAALDVKDNRVPWITFLGGAFGAAAGYAMQIYTNWDFPIDTGGRPLFAWQPFMLITFETCVLFAVLAAVLGMLLLNRLPRLHHPVFDIDRFNLVSTDRFFLIVFGNDPRFDVEATAEFLRSLNPVMLFIVGQTEEPE
ncbi:DUF3341 domain-containing protein [Rhizobium leguminosarum]|uniref:DUF3341 domain-containing protein n=1 Tax=Rhizobium leguminosarum TaxID=384 RepID=UPI001C943B90|nr:DUF3341 domain-containing protein [Rhizobium leguminosarum]MBY5371108.1 DUF3341 domain-containing protein [Rhizobium leguminosarum]